MRNVVCFYHCLFILFNFVIIPVHTFVFLLFYIPPSLPLSLSLSLSLNPPGFFEASYSVQQLADQGLPASGERRAEGLRAGTPQGLLRGGTGCASGAV